MWQQKTGIWHFWLLKNISIHVEISPAEKNILKLSLKSSISQVLFSHWPTTGVNTKTRTFFRQIVGSRKCVKGKGNFFLFPLKPWNSFTSSCQDQWCSCRSLLRGYSALSFRRSSKLYSGTEKSASKHRGLEQIVEKNFEWVFFYFPDTLERFWGKYILKRFDKEA